MVLYFCQDFTVKWTFPSMYTWTLYINSSLTWLTTVLCQGSCCVFVFYKTNAVLSSRLLLQSLPVPSNMLFLKSDSYPHGYEHPHKAVIGQHPPGSGVLYCMQLVYEVLMANKFTNELVTLFSRCSHFS